MTASLTDWLPQLRNRRYASRKCPFLRAIASLIKHPGRGQRAMLGLLVPTRSRTNYRGFYGVHPESMKLAGSVPECGNLYRRSPGRNKLTDLAKITLILAADLIRWGYLPTMATIAIVV